MTHTVRYLGAPGCGKTTALRQALRDERDEHGASPWDVYWLCFTNSGADDTIDSFLDVFDRALDDPDDADGRVRTFHSLALKLARDEGIVEEQDEQVIQQRSGAAHYRAFCNDVGLGYSEHADDPLRDDKDTSGVPAGNKIFRAAEYLKVRELPAKKVRLADRKLDLPMSNREAYELIQKWEQFKRDGGALDGGRRLFTHADYVAEVAQQGLVPDVDALLLDEFQDLSPLELTLFEQWAGAVDRVYIAGDPAQSVYAFRGARPEYLENLDADDTHELRDSYRCPSNIADAAASVLTRHRATTDYRFAGRTAGGDVREVRSRGSRTRTVARDLADRLDGGLLDTHDGDGNAVLLLARTNRRARQIGKSLRERGIPYSWLSRHRGWDKDMKRIMRALTMLTDGEKPMRNDGRALFNNLPGDRDADIRWSSYDAPGDETTAADLLDRIPESPAEAATELDMPDWKCEALANALADGYDVDPDAIRVGTIHASKGLEAPHVYLDTHAPKQVRRGYQGRGGAEEHRLFYVGASRASASLTWHVVPDGRRHPALRGVVS
jgi:superfamily I DNA/RNA helicase